MPSYKEKAERSQETASKFTDIHERFDEMEARSLVDGAILREVRNRVQQLSIAADASADIEKLAHLANQLKINFGEIETLAGVSSSVTLPPGEYTAEAVLNNLNQRMSDLLSHLKASRASSDAIIREIMGYPISSHVADGKIRIGGDKHHPTRAPKEVFPEHRDITRGPMLPDARPVSSVPPPRSDAHPPRHEPSRPASAGTNAMPPGHSAHKPAQSVGNVPTEHKSSPLAGLFGGQQKKSDSASRH